MNRLGFALVAISLAALPLVAHAEDASSAPAPDTSSSASAPAPVAAAPGDPFSFSDVVAGITSKEPSWSNIDKIDKTTNIAFLELSTLDGYDSKRLQFSADQLKALTTRQAKVGRNNALMRKLRRAGYQLSDVIAVSIGGGGEVAVFINL